ncbi:MULTISPECIES: hypothetical protein [unclassified Endozoicomonas]|uniref:hypothetical protein n=1 Tax=unclassified Endozoicomonas TaxID=2644528 RepID=UPI002147F908|nr:MULTISPECIES: hypothetical protein [unclassified Endozoicomonas]
MPNSLLEGCADDAETTDETSEGGTEPDKVRAIEVVLNSLVEGCAVDDGAAGKTSESGTELDEVLAIE